MKYITVILFCALTNYTFCQCWTKISGGEYHVLAIKDDGTLWAWGNNAHSQIGDGTDINKNYPILIDNNTIWTEIAAGLHHSLAIKSDGTLWAWGSNHYYQLGDATNIDKAYPTQIGIDSDWVSVRAGSLHSIGLKEDGTLWVWGNNSSRQLGLGNIYEAKIPTRINDSKTWNYISTGNSHCMATKEDGTLWAWGQNGINEQIGAGAIQLVSEPMEILHSELWKEIEGGIHHNILLDVEGHIWTIGDNLYGQLGDASFEDNGAITRISSEKWSTVTAGRHHNAAILQDSSLWAWGRNIFGQLGDGSSANSNVPLNVGTHIKWIDVTAGFGYTLGLDADGQIWGTGDNQFGQLGAGSFEEITGFTKIECPQSTNNINQIDIDYQIRIYPNPADEFISLYWYSPDIDQLNCTIIDHRGSVIRPAFKVRKKEKINIENINAGVYYIKLWNENMSTISKMIKINTM